MLKFTAALYVIVAISLAIQPEIEIEPLAAAFWLPDLLVHLYVDTVMR